MKNNHFNFTHHYSHAESKDFCIEAELNRKWRNDFLNRLVFQACVCVSYILRVLHSEDLLSEVLQVIKGRLGCDGVDQSKTLTVLHVKVSHCCELLLQTDPHTQTDGQRDRQIQCMANSMSVCGYHCINDSPFNSSWK